MTDHDEGTSVAEGGVSLSTAAENLLKAATGGKADKDEQSEPQEDTTERDEREVESHESNEPPAADPADDDEDESGDDEEAEEKPESRKIKVKDGDREIEVDEDELKASYMRQSDYTRKRQAEAAAAKAVETEAAQLRAERSEYAKYLTDLKTSLEQLQGKEPDWASMADDPPTLAAEYAKWNLSQQNIAKVANEQNAVRARAQADSDAQAAKRYESEKEALFKAIPEWKDPKIAKAEASEILEYGLEMGFSQEDLQITDHRIIRLLRDAVKSKRTEKKQESVKEKIAKATVEPSVPGTPVSRKVTKQKALDNAAKRVAKTGDVKDGAEWLFRRANMQ